MSPTTTDDRISTSEHPGRRHSHSNGNGNGKVNGRSQVSPPLPFISTRVSKNIGDVAIMERFARILADQYHAEHNPEGIINLGVAENALMYRELTEFINKTLTVDNFTCTYGSGPTGGAALRTALSGLFNTRFRPFTTVTPSQIVVSAGVTTLLESLAWTLADPEDGILVGRPFYSAFPNDFYARARVHTVAVGFHGSDPFAESCVGYYERALQEWNGRPLVPGKVRALVVVNPHNPLGECYSPEALKEIMRFCHRERIHFVCDEIYALSAYDNPRAEKSFTSALSIDTHGIIDPALVHVLYGMSKDFSANGFRLGAFVSQSNPSVLQGLGSISHFGWPSGLAEAAWTAILSDAAFLDSWITTNSQRLGENYTRATAILDSHGIKYHCKGNAALFLWLDLSPFLPAGYADAVTAERELARRLLEAGVFIAGGDEFRAETPGCFRVVFSMPWDWVQEGLNRVLAVCGVL